MNRWKTGTRVIVLLAAICIAVPGVGRLSGARAQVVLPNPDLPPESDPADCEDLVSLYASQEQILEYSGAGFSLTMRDVRHRCFMDVFRETAGDDEIERFDSIWDAVVDYGTGPIPVSLTGPVEIRTSGKALSATGRFDAEIVSLSLSGDAGGLLLQLREDPALASQGMTEITDLGGGLYQVESFFDVFTELSVDGGQTWIRAHSSMILTLVPVSSVGTEPSSWGAIKSIR